MKTRSSLLLIAVFLAVQCLSILHTAEYGFAKHTHSGHICQIFLHTDKSKFVDVQTPVPMPIAVDQQVHGRTLTTVLFSTAPFSSRLARAPPVFLHS